MNPEPPVLTPPAPTQNRRHAVTLKLLFIAALLNFTLAPRGQLYVSKDPEKVPQRVINLMDALRASIGSQTQKKPAAPSAKARAGAATTAKRKTGR